MILPAHYLLYLHKYPIWYFFKKKNSMEQVITSAVTEEEVETQKMVNCSRSQGPE